MPAHAEQAVSDGIVDVPAQILEGHVAGLRADVADRLVLGVDPCHLRLEDSVGKVAADLLDGVADVVDRAVGRRAELELDEGRAVALADRAVDLVDAVDAAHRGFDALRDLGFHLVRSGARLDDGRSPPGSRCPAHCSPACGRRRSGREHQPDEQDDRETGLRMHQDEMLRKFMR